MKKNVCFINMIVQVVMLIFMMSAAAIPGYAGELRDYSLPSERNALYYGPRTTTPLDEFRATVRPLTPQQRKRLKDDFERKRDKATNRDERAYYQNLISILDECGVR